MGMGLSALAPLLNGQQGNLMLPKGPHFAPKAKRVIHLFMNGGPLMLILSTQSLNLPNGTEKFYLMKTV